MRVILRAGEQLPGPGGEIADFWPEGFSTGPDGTTCFMVRTVNDATHLACDVGGVVATLLSDGQTFPGTNDLVDLATPIPNNVPITGNGFVLVDYGSGTGLIQAAGGVGYREIEEAIPPLSMTPDGSVIAWVDGSGALRGDFGAGPVTILDGGLEPLDGTESGCYVLPPANVIPSGTIFASAYCDDVGWAVVQADGTFTRSTPLRQGVVPPDARPGEYLEEIIGLRAGPSGHVFALIRVLGGADGYRLYRLDPDDEVLAVPRTIDGEDIVHEVMPPIEVAADGSALVLVSILDGTAYGFARIDEDGAASIVVRGGDPVPGVPGVTYEPYLYVQLGLSAGGHLAFNTRTDDGSGEERWAMLQGTFGEPLELAALTGQPLEEGGPPVQVLFMRPAGLRAGGSQAVSATGAPFLAGTAALDVFDLIAVSESP